MTLRGGWQDRRILEHRGLRLWSGRPGTAVLVVCHETAVSGLQFMTLRGVWSSGGVVARSVVYWAGFCRLCRRAALGMAMPRASLNVLRPGTGDLCPRPYALPRDGITAGPSVRPALSTPTQAGCTTGRQQVVRDCMAVAERSAGVPQPRGPRPVVAPRRRCHARRVYARTHARGDDDRVW